jgi:hypothetical protein
VLVVDATPGLPPEGADLVRARPETALPTGGGDATLIANRVVLGAP